jgi:hypothetical protein
MSGQAARPQRFHFTLKGLDTGTCPVCQKPWEPVTLYCDCDRPQPGDEERAAAAHAYSARCREARLRSQALEAQEQAAVAARTRRVLLRAAGVTPLDEAPSLRTPARRPARVRA